MLGGHDLIQRCGVVHPDSHPGPPPRQPHATDSGSSRAAPSCMCSNDSITDQARRRVDNAGLGDGLAAGSSSFVRQWQCRLASAWERSVLLLGRVAGRGTL